jgi:hypothetical protein
MRDVKPLLLAAVLGVSTACGESEAWRSSPTAPTVITATPSPAPSGTPLHVGETVTGTIEPSDPTCGTGEGTDQQEPCKLFAISVHASGTLTVLATSPGPSGLAVRFGRTLDWGQRVRLSAIVQGGATYEIGVALHDGRGSGSQAFELTTSFEPL